MKFDRGGTIQNSVGGLWNVWGWSVCPALSNYRHWQKQGNCRWRFLHAIRLWWECTKTWAQAIVFINISSSIITTKRRDQYKSKTKKKKETDKKCISYINSMQWKRVLDVCWQASDVTAVVASASLESSGGSPFDHDLSDHGEHWQPD